MTYFSCEECGQLVDLQTLDEEPRRDHCPVCEEQTVWTVAFAGEGVSF